MLLRWWWNLALFKLDHSIYHLLLPINHQRKSHWAGGLSAATSGLTQKGLNSLIVLGAWIIWNHHNSCVFDRAIPNIAETFKLAGDERRRWTMAGARGLSHLTAPAQAVSWFVVGAGSLFSLLYWHKCILWDKDKGVWVCVVLRVLCLLFLLNIMKHSSPVFSRKKTHLLQETTLAKWKHMKQASGQLFLPPDHITGNIHEVTPFSQDDLQSTTYYRRPTTWRICICQTPNFSI
jgi:hypothetical protein